MQITVPKVPRWYSMGGFTKMAFRGEAHAPAKFARFSEGLLGTLVMLDDRVEADADDRAR